MNHSVMFFFLLLEKVSVWQPVTLHITSAWHLYPGCYGNVVAMRSIYLEIWRLQMSLGAALNNKASVRLQTVKAPTLFLFWPRLTEKILIMTQNVSQVSDSMDILVSWILQFIASSFSGSFRQKTLSQTRTVKYWVHQMNTIRCQSRSKCSLTYSLSSSSITLLCLPPVPRCWAVQWGPCMTHVSAPLTWGSVQKWEYHLLAFQSLIPLSCIWKSIYCCSAFITKWLKSVGIIACGDSHLPRNKNMLAIYYIKLKTLLVLDNYGKHKGDWKYDLSYH